MICIYHSRDLDGWMSAAIVKLWYERPNDYFDARIGELKLIGWDYGDPIPEIQDSNETVVMVDVSWPKEEMEELQKHRNLIWIDHHISAIKELDPFYLDGLRDNKFAACELTWVYFMKHEPMPELVRLLGRYDCFGHKGTDEETDVLRFQYGARMTIGNADDAYECLKMCLIEGDHGLLMGILKETGRAIYGYLRTEAQQIYAQRFTIEFDGFYFAAVNRERFNPINFGIDYHQDKANDIYYYDGFACFWYDGEKKVWTFSLYNDNGHVDCSEICKNRGGGGHKGAAGFVTDSIYSIIKQ